MQPLPSEIRDALKRTYPKLTDAMIDRAEELLVLRSQLDPDRQVERVRALDRERAELIEREMPEYGEMVRAALAAFFDLAQPSAEPSPSFEPSVTPTSDDAPDKPRLRGPKRRFPRPPAPSPDP